MFSPNITLTLKDTAIIQEIADESVILDSKSGQYYTLNSMASEMLKHLQNGLTLQQVKLAIVEAYEVSDAELTEDLHNVVTLLIEKELAYIH